MPPSGQTYRIPDDPAEFVTYIICGAVGQTPLFGPMVAVESNTLEFDTDKVPKPVIYQGTAVTVGCANAGSVKSKKAKNHFMVTLRKR